MKQLGNYFIVLVYIVLTTLSGGNVETRKLEVNREVTTESTAVYCTLYDYTGRGTSYGPSDLSVDKKIDGEWVPVEYKEITPLNDIAYFGWRIKSSVVAQIGNMYEPLEIGEYRVVFDYVVDKSLFKSAYTDTLYAEFEVTR